MDCMKKNSRNNRFQGIYILPEISRRTVSYYWHTLTYQHQLEKSECSFECLICTSSLLNKWSNINKHLKHPSHIVNVKKDCKQFTAFCILCRYIFIADDPDSIFQHFTLHTTGTGKVYEQAVQESFNDDPASHSSSICSSSTLYKDNTNIHTDSTSRKSEVLNEKKCLDNGKDRFRSFDESALKICINPDVEHFDTVTVYNSMIKTCKKTNMEAMNIDNKRTSRQSKHLPSIENKNNIEVVTDSTNSSVSKTSFYPEEAFFSNKKLQLISPGVTKDEFTISRKLNNINIQQYCTETYYSEYYELRKMYFSCLECKTLQLRENLFYIHLSQVKHYKNLGDNYSSCFIKICDICQVLLLGRFYLIKEHFQSRPHKKCIKWKLPTIKEQYDIKSGDQKLGFSGLLTDRCTNFFSSQETLNNWVESSLKEAREVASLAYSLKRILVRDFSETLKEKYSDFNVEIFGSRLYGLADWQSDLDIYLNIGKASVCDLEEYFHRAGDLFEVKRTIPDAKVPLLRVRHLKSNLICDINTTEPGGVYRSNLIKLYISLDERVHWLVMAVVKWSEENNIRGFRKFKSYALMCLTLCFLMSPNIRLIPSVNELKSLSEGSRLDINGWDYYYCGDIKTITNKHNPLLCNLNKYELLAEFFKFYSKYDARRNIIFPHSGEVYSKVKFANRSKKLPGFERNQKRNKFNFSDTFIVFDFFNLTENVTGSVDENLFDHFKSICHETLLCGWQN